VAVHKQRSGAKINNFIREKSTTNESEKSTALDHRRTLTKIAGPPIPTLTEVGALPNPDTSDHSPHCPDLTLAVAVATPGNSSPRKYFSFAARITGIAAYGFE
jgi:hypothetical protein